MGLTPLHLGREVQTVHLGGQFAFVGQDPAALYLRDFALPLQSGQGVMDNGKFVRILGQVKTVPNERFPQF